jgi:hypothetical protein
MEKPTAEPVDNDVGLPLREDIITLVFAQH